MGTPKVPVRVSAACEAGRWLPMCAAGYPCRVSALNAFSARSGGKAASRAPEARVASGLAASSSQIARPGSNHSTEERSIRTRTPEAFAISWSCEPALGRPALYAIPGTSHRLDERLQVRTTVLFGGVFVVVGVLLMLGVG